MAPTVVAVGAVATGTTTITPASPAGIAAGDALFTIAESVGGQNYTLPSGWAHVTGSPVVQSTNTQLTVIWRLYDGVFTAPALTGTVDHSIGRMIAVRGCPTTGNPWDVVATAVEAVSDTTATWPGATTTVASTLVLEIIASSADVTPAGTTQLGALTNAAYTSITEQMDNNTPTGNGGIIGCVSGVKATAGATGQSTATLTTAGFKAFMTLALKDATQVVNPIVLQRSPRPVEQHTVVGAYAPANPSTLLGG
jgi:hypothetical protein